CTSSTPITTAFRNLRSSNNRPGNHLLSAIACAKQTRPSTASPRHRGGLGRKGGDLFVLGVGVGLAALVVAGEGRGAVVEELLLPGVEEVDGDAEFFTDVGDRDFLDEVQPACGDLLFRGIVAALPSHGISSARVLPLTPAKANSRSDWGNTA